MKATGGSDASTTAARAGEHGAEGAPSASSTSPATERSPTHESGSATTHMDASTPPVADERGGGLTTPDVPFDGDEERELDELRRFRVRTVPPDMRRQWLLAEVPVVSSVELQDTEPPNRRVLVGPPPPVSTRESLHAVTRRLPHVAAREARVKTAFAMIAAAIIGTAAAIAFVFGVPRTPAKSETVAAPPTGEGARMVHTIDEAPTAAKPAEPVTDERAEPATTARTHDDGVPNAASDDVAPGIVTGRSAAKPHGGGSPSSGATAGGARPSPSTPKANAASDKGAATNINRVHENDRGAPTSSKPASKAPSDIDIKAPLFGQ